MGSNEQSAASTQRKRFTEASAPPPPQSKKKKRKRKRNSAGDESWDEDAGGEESWDEDDAPLTAEEEALALLRGLRSGGDPPPPPRGGGAFDFAQQPYRQKPLRDVKAMMVVDSVKGKVSNDNKGFSDADLERRFQGQDTRQEGSLMTEEQVLKMIRKEKIDHQVTAGPGSASASRRIQKELAEWAATKEQQRARVKSPHRFERMVVARR